VIAGKVHTSAAESREMAGKVHIGTHAHSPGRRTAPPPVNLMGSEIPPLRAIEPLGVSRSPRVCANEGQAR
jgi:hypothetical protein